MRNTHVLVVLVLMCTVPLLGQEKENERIDEAANVMKEILGMPEGIPSDLAMYAVQE